MGIKEFARQLWPGAGMALCSGAPGQGPVRQKFVSSVDEVVEALEDVARRDDYHLHWTLFNFSGSVRKNAEAVKAKAFAVDVDAPPEGEAKEQLAAFIANTLRPSWVVSTGRGLHLYWTLDEAIGLDEWLDVAKRVRAVFSLYPAIAEDPSKTTAPATTYRVPGSMNHKRGVRATLLESNGTGQTYTLAEVRAGFGLPDIDLSDLPAFTPLSAPDQGPPPKVPSTAMLLRYCTPVASLSEAPAQQSYEAWWAAARLFAWSEDEAAGRAAFHEFSSGHPDYDPDETDDKFDNARDTAVSPPDCATLRRLAGVSRCTNCPIGGQQNGMPTRLASDTPAPPPTPGRGAERKPSEAARAVNAALALLETHRAATTGFVPVTKGSVMEAHLATLLDPRRAVVLCPDTGRMIGLPDDSDDEAAAVELATAGFSVLFTAGISSGGVAVAMGIVRKASPAKRRWKTPAELRGLLSRYSPADGEWEYTIFVPDGGDLGDRYTPARLLGAIEKAGVVVQNTPKAAVMVRAYLSASYMRVPPAYTIEEGLGWQKDGSFALGDAVAANGLVRFDPVRAKLGLAAPSGDYDSATLGLHTTLAKLTEFGRSVVWTTLAAPLVKHSIADSILVYLSGPGGSGKTALAKVATGLWTSHLKTGKDLIHGADTALSMFHVVSALRSIPVCADELTLMDRQNFGLLALQLTQGREKHRMNPGGTSMRKGRTWETVVVGTSNEPLTTAIPPTSAADVARLSRVIDFGDMPLWQDVSKASDAIRRMADAPGAIGLDLVMRLTAMDEDGVRDMVDGHMRHDLFTEAAHLGGDIGRFWRASCACACAVADIYAPIAGLDRDIEIEAIVYAHKTAFGAWVDKVDKAMTRALIGLLHKLKGDTLTVMQRVGSTSVVSLPPRSGASASTPSVLLLTTAGTREAVAYVSEQDLIEAARRASDHSTTVSVDYLAEHCHLSLGWHEKVDLPVHASNMDLRVTMGRHLRIALPLAVPASVDNDMARGLVFGLGLDGEDDGEPAEQSVA